MMNLVILVIQVIIIDDLVNQMILMQLTKVIILGNLAILVKLKKIVNHLYLVILMELQTIFIMGEFGEFEFGEFL